MEVAETTTSPSFNGMEVAETTNPWSFQGMEVDETTNSVPPASFSTNTFTSATTTTSSSTITTTTGSTTTSTASTTTRSTSTTSMTTTSMTTTATTSSTSTSTTTTSTATSTTLTTMTVTLPPWAMLCFILMLPDSYELSLVALQYKKHAGVFACENFALYSSKVIEVVPGIKTGVVNSDLKCELGGEFKTALNRQIFMAVWDKVLADGQWRRHGWIVKADADTVFFPDRLRVMLMRHTDRRRGVYFNNCKFGLHGPLEVFSKNAVGMWAAGMTRCVAHFHKLCSGPCRWGEDMFIDQCLLRVLKVRRESDWDVLQEDHCDAPKGWRSCSNGSKAAFHPFKEVDDYRACLSGAPEAKE
mmetsp:Transcript_134081/g.298975  ORF Transcript_134081/g.298975 Transcript_134081/m.298975 type:complete len:358 (-) Transcript_134081:11-1084(-)